MIYTTCLLKHYTGETFREIFSWTLRGLIEVCLDCRVLRVGKSGAIQL